MARLATFFFVALHACGWGFKAERLDDWVLHGSVGHFRLCVVFDKRQKLRKYRGFRVFPACSVSMVSVVQNAAFRALGPAGAHHSHQLGPSGGSAGSVACCALPACVVSTVFSFERPLRAGIMRWTAGGGGSVENTFWDFPCLSWRKSGPHPCSTLKPKPFELAVVRACFHLYLEFPRVKLSLSDVLPLGEDCLRCPHLAQPLKDCP